MSDDIDMAHYVPAPSLTRRLMSFAEVALRSGRPKVDHTYAIHGRRDQRDCKPKVLDSECLIQREKDHNYSYTSKHGKSHEDLTTIDKEAFRKRSLSEENLNKTLHISRPVISAPQQIGTLPHFRSLSSESMSCDSTFPDSSVLCNSWPKSNHLESYESLDRDHSYATCTRVEINMQSLGNRDFSERKSREDGSSETLNRLSKISVKSDHAYSDVQMKEEEKFTSKPQCVQSFRNDAKDCVKFDHAYVNKANIFGSTSNKITENKFSVKNDHAYFDKNKSVHFETDQKRSNLTSYPHCHVDHPYFDQQFQKDNITVPSKNPLIRSVSDSLQCNRGDHNYYNGSLESLDMDLSASDTDSCDETAREETRLAFSAWCQLRKDHPYSSI